MNHEGVIKFNCTWIKEKPLQSELISDLNSWRDILYSLGLIGLNKDGIGFGNISKRFNQNQFIITGSATGKYEKLTNEHYTKVTRYDFDKNTVTAVGPIIASSESLSHAAIYEADLDTNSVIHIHHHKLWHRLLKNVPATDSKIEYGTPEMAGELLRLLRETDLKEKKILVMAGHEDGIISFGRNLEEAGKIILDNFK